MTFPSTINPSSPATPADKRRSLETLPSAIDASSPRAHGDNGRSRELPHAFTQQGVAMLSSVLRSPRAIEVNVEIMRAFVRLRRMLQGNAELARRLDALEEKYDENFRVVSMRSGPHGAPLDTEEAHFKRR